METTWCERDISIYVPFVDLGHRAEADLGRLRCVLGDLSSRTDSLLSILRRAVTACWGPFDTEESHSFPIGEMLLLPSWKEWCGVSVSAF